LTGERLREAEAGDFETKRIRNAGRVITREAAVELGDEAGA
jgi:hypothetical protein